MESKLVFWDWTGTLADESKLDKAVCEAMEKEIAKKRAVPLREAKKIYHDYLKTVENTWKWHNYVLHCKEFDIDWKKCQRENLGKMVLVPHAKEILRYVRKKGYKNILATNAVRPVILLRINYVKMKNLFDFIITCDDVKALKAKGKHFRKGLKKFNARPENCFSIGDNPVQDIKPAKKLGLKTIYCKFGQGLTHYHSDHISKNHNQIIKASYEINSLKEIEGII